MPNNIHSRIKYRRIEIGLSQAALARSCNVGQSTVANWENGGHIPRHASLYNIARTLNIKESWLLSGDTAGAPDSLNHYLNTAIRHIPIYKWPDNRREHTKIMNGLNNAPARYMSLSIDQGDIFALEAQKDVQVKTSRALADSARADPKITPNTVLIFTRETVPNTAGVYLAPTDSAPELVQYPELPDYNAEYDQSIKPDMARLIYSLNMY